MLKITFKNVGQGDSIILEWSEEMQDAQQMLKKRIGIIDCNLHQGKNPVLLHIIQENYREIEFLLLSHPHDDHFSGFLELLEYLDTNNIKIKIFYHTSQQVPEFLKTACNSITATKNLNNLFRKLRADDKKDKYVLQYINSFSPPIKFGNAFEMQCLSPSSREENDYPKSNTNHYDTDNEGNNPKANLLSTVFKITQNTKESGVNSFILLTSDVPKTVLERLGKKEAESLTGLLTLGQSPHHGAKSNHYSAFWRNLNVKKGCFAVFSVGENQYKHPSQEAVDFFADSFQIRYTNKIGVLNQITTKTPKTTPLKNIQNNLNMITFVVDNGKDCIFEFENGTIQEK